MTGAKTVLVTRLSDEEKTEMEEKMLRINKVMMKLVMVFLH